MTIATLNLTIATLNLTIATLNLAAAVAFWAARQVAEYFGLRLERRANG